MPSGGEGQLTQTGLAARRAKPAMTSEISAPLAASDPAMNRIVWISGSAATASRALRQERQGLRAEGRGRGEVERVRRGRHRDEERPEPLHARGAQGRRTESESRALVHRQDAVAPAEGDDANPAPRWHPVTVPRQQERDVHELLDREDPDHAQLPEDGVDHAVLADEGTRVGLGRAGAGGRGAGLDEDDGLATKAGLLERPDELLAVGGALEVAGDDVRALVPGERIEVVGVADDRLVPAADHVATPEAGLLDKGERGRRDPAALGDDRDAAGPERVHLQERGGERRGRRHRRVDHPDAVGPAQREPGLAAQRDQRRAGDPRPPRPPRRGRPRRRHRSGRRPPRTPGPPRGAPPPGRPGRRGAGLRAGRRRSRKPGSRPRPPPSG